MEQINTKGFNEGDIASLEGQVDIDDDNAPAPENIPTPSNESGNQIFYSRGHDGVCQYHYGIPSILQTFELLFQKYMLKK